MSGRALRQKGNASYEEIDEEFIEVSPVKPLKKQAKMMNDWSEDDEENVLQDEPMREAKSLDDFKFTGTKRVASPVKRPNKSAK